MTVNAKRMAAAAAAIAANLVLISCSSGPTPPQKGTPAFYWQAARESYAAGDYLRTIENLDGVAKTDNEFTGRARPWLLIMTSGVAKGNIDIAEYFEGGARVNKADPLTFRKQMSTARGTAGRLALQFAEEFAGFQKGKEDPVVLDFPYPTGSPAVPPALYKAGNGMLPEANEIETAQKAAIQRGVLLTTMRAAGSPDDTAKVQSVFKAGNVTVPRAVFLTAMANALHEQAQLFSRNKLDQPEKLQIFCARAQEALKGIPESKETKELGTKIQATLKKAKV